MLGLHGRLPDDAVVRRMTAAIRHRGPDDEGFRTTGPVSFGFRRLAILDLGSDAHQPMVSRDGAVTLVFNGEIYNYVELREELRRAGHEFRSSGDTEVLLHAYLEWGPDCLSRLNGMWAFLVYDERRKLLFGSRDRFGVKPLYRLKLPDGWLFASEIKAIVASGLYRTDTNWRAVSRYLVAGRLDETSETFYSGVTQVPAGSAFEITADGVERAWRYWNLPAADAAPVDDAPARFAEIFEDAVRLRMRSDVPVGVCLSGGLDSTSIKCAMARARDAAGTAEPLLAFTFHSEEFDESQFVADTVQQAGARLVHLEMDEQALWDSVGTVLGFQDEPVHSMTAVVGFHLMRIAREHGVEVVLNGQGADEVLGGYPSYFRDLWYTQLVTRGPRAALREISAYAGPHGASAARLAANLARHSALAALGRIPGYKQRAHARRRARLRGHDWFEADLTSRFSNGVEPESHILSSVLRDSVERHPLPLYLRIEDRNSMAHSVEARLPFLDYRLVTFAFTLAPELKLKGPWNKYVLREAMRGRIPESVRTRVDKMGFPTPVRRWIAGRLAGPIRDLVGSQAARERGIYRVDRILGALDAGDRISAQAANAVVRVAQFELWARATGT